MSISKSSTQALSMQVEHYLSRLRRTALFPFDRMDFYYTLLPKTFKEWVNVKGLPTGQALDVRVGNALKTISRADGGHAVQMAIGPDDDCMFWVKVDDGTPVPVPSQIDYLQVQKGHVHHKALKQWWQTASKIEEDIIEVCEYLRKIEKHNITSGWLARHWPNLLNIVSVPVGTSLTVKQKLHLDMQVVARADELITAALMLPEANTPLQAWVEYYTGEEL